MASAQPVPEPSRAMEIARLELSRCPADTSLEDFFCQACELSARAIEVERVGVWLFIDNRTVLRCANLFERSKGEHSAGALLRVADFPTYFSSLSIRKAIPAEVAATEPWTAELAQQYLQPLSITSMLDAGIFVDGTLIGVVCHEHVGPPREWTTEARDFAGSVADLLALRIQSAEVRDLRAAFLTQRERAAALDKAAALERLAASIAHDFRNLLTVLMGQGELLCTRLDVPPEVRQQGKAILTTAERGIAMAKELLDFARPQQRPPAVVDLGEVTAEFLPVLRASLSDKYDLRFNKPAALGQVLIDRTQFCRLLHNLVINAREAMPNGGPIELTLTPVRISGNPGYSGAFVMLEVIDRGGGMDEATRRRIFEPYYSTKSTGTGLGLAIVRQIVDRVGGMIRVESKLGQGTTFRLYFPRIGASTGGTISFMLPPEGRDAEAS